MTPVPAGRYAVTHGNVSNKPVTIVMAKPA